MATSDITYMSIHQVRDVYPAISDFDFKTRVYGWQQGILNFTSSVDLYFVHNSGHVKNLYLDGSEIDKIDYVSSATTQISVATTPSHNSLEVDSTTGFGNNDIIKINGEYLRVVSITDGNTLELGSLANRGLFNTNAQHHPVDSNVFRIIDSSINDIGGVDSQGLDALSFIYDDDLDLCLLVTVDTNPANYLIETGDNYEDFHTRFRKQACRLFESRIDSQMTREISKNRDGDYPAIVTRACALQCVILMLSAHDPTSEVLESFKLEYEEIVDGLTSGAIALDTARTKDMSKGVRREVSVNSSSTVRPVELKGSYNGFGYDLIKVKVITGGAIGTSTYSVWVKGDDTLKTKQVVTAEKISGDFDKVTNSLWIRWAGVTASSVTTVNDEYEIEVWGTGMDTSIPSSVTSVGLTRR